MRQFVYLRLSMRGFLSSAFLTVIGVLTTDPIVGSSFLLIIETSSGSESSWRKLGAKCINIWIWINATSSLSVTEVNSRIASYQNYWLMVRWVKHGEIRTAKIMYADVLGSCACVRIKALGKVHWLFNGFLRTGSVVSAQSSKDPMFRIRWRSSVWMFSVGILPSSTRYSQSADSDWPNLFR